MRDYTQEGLEAFANTDMEKAAWCYWQAAQHDEILRDQLQHLSNYYFCLHYMPRLSPMDLSQQIMFYDKLYQDVETFPQVRQDNHKIRIGYLSADFRQHAMTSFIRPLLSCCNREDFEVYVYAMNEADIITEEFIQYDVQWRQIDSVSAFEAAQKINEDRIDILWDLCGHTNGGLSLMIMAYKPARIQLSGIGWLSTTGLSSIDYFISDEFSMDCENVEKLYSEQILRFPNISQLCYTHTGELPTIELSTRGCVTYASFSNFDKISDEVLKVWKKIIDRVPNSKLLLKDTTEIISRQLAMAKRLENIGFTVGENVSIELADENYLSHYNDVDVALDTFPYTGGATVCDALSMGVPVVSLAGDAPSRRLGASVLYYAGMKENIAYDISEYINIAVELAEKKSLEKRLEIRDKFLQSSLTDTNKYVRSLEYMYKSLLKG